MVSVRTDRILSKSLTTRYSALITHYSPRDFFEYIAKFEATSNNGRHDDDDGLTRLSKAVLSNQRTVRFANDVDIKPDPKLM